MNLRESLEKLLRSFERYYDIRRNDESELFAAEAEFHTHTEQYFLIKSAKLSQEDCNEYVYFALDENLDTEGLDRLADTAWERGLSRIDLHESHRNSDVTLVILAETIEEDAFKRIPYIRHYKSFRHGWSGWSHFRMVAVELSSGRAASNRQGRRLKKLVSNIFA